jgi:hypothetical protein
MAEIPLPKIVERLNNMESKWKNANSEVSDVCRDAATEIMHLRDTVRKYEHIIFSREFYMGSG